MTGARRSVNDYEEPFAPRELEGRRACLCLNTAISAYKNALPGT